MYIYILYYIDTVKLRSSTRRTRKSDSPLSNTGCSASTRLVSTTAVVAVAQIRANVGVAEWMFAAPYYSAGDSAADRKTCLQRSFPGPLTVSRSNSIGGTSVTRYIVYSTVHGTLQLAVSHASMLQ